MRSEERVDANGQPPDEVVPVGVDQVGTHPNREKWGEVRHECGDGATSEGDFHEALNSAAVFHLPVIFFVQNNKYAISVPLAHQSVAPSLAHKAVGYGMAGERVDGNDVVALLAVLDRAVKIAREGSGPLLVEANTYRMQAHTNADDDTHAMSGIAWSADNLVITAR